MAQPEGPQSEPQPTTAGQKLRQFFGLQQNGIPSLTVSEAPAADQSASCGYNGRNGLVGAGQNGHARTSRSVIPGLPRAQTLKRQLSESRAHLIPVNPSLDERRAASMDRRPHAFSKSESHIDAPPSRPSSSCFLGLPPKALYPPASEQLKPKHFSRTRQESRAVPDQHGRPQDNLGDSHSVISTRLEDVIRHELETTWILNLSMHFKDHSNREKFFVTYRQTEHLWRRVTISLDYNDAPPRSLELDLSHEKYQKTKSAKIYEAIRDSLNDIQFYDTVTNLKLETESDRLHIHVVEDGNEIIEYPSVGHVAHLGCRHIPESSINFDSHMSGFVYKVHVGNKTLIKKEIPGPDTIQEFLYEVNALNSLADSNHIIDFYGLVVDDEGQDVKGLLIGYADHGALTDIIYDHCIASNQGLSWALRERWAQQIIQGLADVHESGFVQGDFTLSNIVIDEKSNAKLIDINRRGCPVGWEPPEAAPLLKSNNRIAMYIGNKSDLYQLGMVLWALAMGVDEPEIERERQPLLKLDRDLEIPKWYRQVTEICLTPDPRKRLQASILVQLFPEDSRITVDDEVVLPKYDYHVYPQPQVFMGREASVFSRSSYAYNGYAYNRPPSYGYWSEYDPKPRGRSPGGFAGSYALWGEKRDIRPCYTDVDIDEERPEDVSRHVPPSIPEIVELEKPDQSSSNETTDTRLARGPGITLPVPEKETETQLLATRNEQEPLSQGTARDGTHHFSTTFNQLPSADGNFDHSTSFTANSSTQPAPPAGVTNVFSYLEPPSEPARSVTLNDNSNDPLSLNSSRSAEERQTQTDCFSQNGELAMTSTASLKDGGSISHMAINAELDVTLSTMSTNAGEAIGQSGSGNSRFLNYKTTVGEAIPRSAQLPDLACIGTCHTIDTKFAGTELEI